VPCCVSSIRIWRGWGFAAGSVSAAHRAAVAAIAGPGLPLPVPVRVRVSEPSARSPGRDAAAGVRRVWKQAVTAPAWQHAPVWIHGDLHPANVVVAAGTLSGVIDFGDMCAGDPATDLSAAWLLLPAGTAGRFFDAYASADDAAITRARGWAVLRALNPIGIGRKWEQGLPGGKQTWDPAGWAALERIPALAP
jgi:hypothetical protein